MQAVQPQPVQPLANLLSIKAKTFLVIDASVSIPQPMFEALSRRAIALTVNGQHNAFQLVSSTLQQHPTINSLHLFTRSHDGEIRLGKHVLDARTTEQHSWDLQEWFSFANHHLSFKRPKIHIHMNSPVNSPVSLTETADLAPSMINPAVIDMLSQLTGAEVIVLETLQ
ncbi:MAG: DUF4347 domain-containing protein [Leptolyngbyaceae bacterium]|nr:DUF4347 domain-containing protein [Leptolyngbyaceae bacterium]